jgi:integrase
MPSLKMSALWLSRVPYPESGRIQYSDLQQQGLVLRIGVTSKTWFCVYRVEGNRKLRRIKLGRYPAIKLADARKKAKNIIVKAENGLDPAAEKQEKRKEDLSAPTFKTLAEIYLSRYAEKKKKPKSIAEDKRILRKDLLPAWGRMKAKSIKRSHVISLIDEVSDRGPVIANRTLALASKMFNVGLERELVDSNPCYRIEKPGKEVSRSRVLTETEIKAVWLSFSNLTPKMQYLMKLRMLTAQRGGEVCSMSWRDIDFEEKVWTIPEEFTKNKKSHRVPLSEQSIKTLNEIKMFLKNDNKRLINRGKPPVNTDWVFPSTHGSATGYIANIQKAAQAIQKESQVSDFKLHDLRRTAASMMAEMGVSEFDIGKVLNHTNGSVTAIYNRHQYDGEKRRALEKWANRLDRIINDKVAKVVNLR